MTGPAAVPNASINPALNKQATKDENGDVHLEAADLRIVTKFCHFLAYYHVKWAFKDRGMVGEPDRYFCWLQNE